MEAGRNRLKLSDCLARDPVKPQNNECPEVKSKKAFSLAMLLIASWFNYINRVADALGVGRE